ncbi:hypothetical protein CHS0354_012491 [Potamilus streckersoni]|uniref:Uncharacterized protein n=1 Tax=Potamilus streckersoni TaxID=2493646 RepID=A0AAE0S099_9BIVA|nr:hypothetical protein CHS0354_012491 [Potamilus streckersoni]
MSAPDEYVPLWVNIMVPIVMLALFVATIVATYFCKYEVPIEKLPRINCRIPCLEEVTISKEESKEEKLKLEKMMQLCSKYTIQTQTCPARQVVYSIPESGRIIGQPNLGYQDDDVDSKTSSRNINSVSSNSTNNSSLRVLTN